jgi:hypothetical protein
MIAVSVIPPIPLVDRHGVLLVESGTIVPAASAITRPRFRASRSLVAFDIDADGGLSKRRTRAHLSDGVPDGICVDQQNAV